MRHGHITVVWLASLAIVSSISGQPSPCDPYLPVSRENPFGYRLRGDRCEGVYIQPVAARPLVVASFGQRNAPEQLPTNGSLLVEWIHSGGEARLRANCLKSKTYYRMDSRQPAGAHSYRWPTDVLAALKLAPKDLGVVAWTERNVDHALRTLYLPVRIGPPPMERDVYELLLVPGDELSEVFVAVSSIGPDGQRVRVSDSKPLRYGFYPAGRSISIPIGPLPHEGTYLVEIGATLRGGGAVSDELWFMTDAKHAR